jgi:hypothetical protein
MRSSPLATRSTSSGRRALTAERGSVSAMAMIIVRNRELWRASGAGVAGSTGPTRRGSAVD